MVYRISNLAACLATALLLTACGGGGGGGSGDDTPVEPPSPPPPANFTLSGTIVAPASQAVDSDTNDRARIAVANDTRATAQLIGKPITLGGYVNRPGSGAPGRSFEQGDTEDYFRVELLAGQRVTMLVADFQQGDADLYLYDTAGKLLDFSIDTGEVESVVVRQDGSYLLNAFAASGATNYILAIGAPGIETAATPEVVPWEAVVGYHDGAGPVPEDAVGLDFAMERRAGDRWRSRLMALHRDPDATNALRRLGPAADKAGDIADPQLLARWQTLQTIKSLRRDPRVRYAEPNYRVRAMAVPDDEAYPLQWHYPLIGLPEAWDITAGSAAVLVAVIDTGILPDHPDLAGKLEGGYDFVRDPESALDGDGIDPDPRDPGSSVGGGSSSFHGTHVAGTVAARGNNRRGVAGVAYGAQLLAVRALGAGGAGTSYDVDQAVRYAAGLPNDSGTVPARAADIINLSLGGAPFSRATQELYNQVRNAGIAVVAAAGNQASTTPNYPASYDGVISVSAVDIQRRLAPYSNTGPDIDVAAPGGDNSLDINGDGYPDGILSTGGTIGDSGINFVYAFLNGTSMASPHVAGVLALMKSANPDLTPADIDAMLAAGELTDDLGAAGRDDRFGHGIINAQRAVFAALTATGTTPADRPRLVASSSALNFGGAGTGLELVLRNGGGGELALAELSASAPWLAITPAVVDAAGLGSYEVTVDRRGLAAGVYAAEINARSTVNEVAVRALMSVGGSGAGTDVGVLYILLYDPVEDQTVDQVASGGDRGNYPFRFEDVAPGAYEIIAGSDTDNDLFICDAGEACGAWLTIDQPIRIQPDSDIGGIDFPVEYLVSLPQITTTRSETVSPRRRTED